MHASSRRPSTSRAPPVVPPGVAFGSGRAFVQASSQHRGRSMPSAGMPPPLSSTSSLSSRPSPGLSSSSSHKSPRQASANLGWGGDRVMSPQEPDLVTPKEQYTAQVEVNVDTQFDNLLVSTPTNLADARTRSKSPRRCEKSLQQCPLMSNQSSSHHPSRPTRPFSRPSASRCRKNHPTSRSACQHHSCVKQSRRQVSTPPSPIPKWARRMRWRATSLSSSHHQSPTRVAFPRLTSVDNPSTSQDLPTDDPAPHLDPCPIFSARLHPPPVFNP